MNTPSKVTYFVLSVLNATAFLLSLKYSFDIYAITDVPSAFGLFILGCTIFLFFILYMLIQGFVFRASDYVNVRVNNWWNKKYLRDHEQ